ncbi:MAG: hypothetical protein K8S55_15450 [Phycisphaerae bacterium]|nr:hypothetical protein [Phycisphaerae bacterium]
MNDTTDAPVAQDVQRVEALATKDPAVRLFIAAAMFIGFGALCLFEVWIQGKYPYVPQAEDINKWAAWLTNHYGPFVFIPPGLVLLVWGVIVLRRRLIADEKGIGYVGKETVGWDSVTQLDASELKSKGIVTLQYGDEKSMKLDSWKLTNFRSLVSLLEQKVPADRQKTA